MTIQTTVRSLLLQHIMTEYSENDEVVRDHIEELTEALTDRQGETFLAIHDGINQYISPRAIRTRQVKLTSTGWPVGLSYYDKAIVTKGGSSEVLACLFPTRSDEECLEFYLSGVREDASGRTSQLDHNRFGIPVRRGIPSLSDNLTQWAIRMFRVGYAHSLTWQL